MRRKPATPHIPFVARPRIKALVVLALVMSSLYSLAAPALATEPGRNGRLVFTSGREGANDNGARLYLREAFGSSGFGALSDPIVPDGGMHRHPSWSPDRTKIVYANGTPTGDPKTEEFDLFIKDMTTGGISALDLNQVADGKSSDHPTWSPDGTRIAYEHQTTDNDANRDVVVKTVGTSAPALAITNGASIELKPAWSRDSQTLFYAKQTTVAPINYNIVRQPAAGGSEEPVLSFADRDEYQPAISADGKKICWTQQSTPGNFGTAEIFVGDLTPTGAANPVNISDDAAKGDINCVWSPDGKKVAYTNGVFSQGRLVMKNSDDTTPVPVELAEDMGSNNFDGNADWAPDGSPDCPDTTVRTKLNTPVTINLECTDTGPAYERTDPNGSVANDGGPKNGTVSDAQPLNNPSTVRYTPKAGFSGTDTIEYIAFDKAGFGTDRGKVTITVEPPPTNGGNNGGDPGAGNGGDVKPKCAGRTATIVGSRGNDRLTGTSRRDVIVAGAGNDTIRAARGNDIVCAGAGNDRVTGGTGRDRIDGGKGRDRLRGGTGRDRLIGGAGSDVLRGDSARDTCKGGGGRNRLRCEVVR